MPEALIVDAVRTPVGKRNGALSKVRADDLLGLTLRELVDRAGVDPALVEDVIAGCVTQIGEQSMNMDPYGDSAGPISPRLSELYEIIPQGISANRIALKYGISREAQDRFSVQSHQKALAAIDEGRFKREVVPVPVADNGASRVVDTDEGPRRD